MSLVNDLKELSSDSRILIVDDNARLRTQLKDFLERFFIEVYEAKDAKEGMEVFKKNTPDIILTDIQMPEVNGLEMVKSIKAINWDIPIVVMSAYDEKEYLLESIRVGVVNYLKKPAKLNVLCEVLIDVLKKIEEKKEKKIFERYTLDLFKENDSLILLYKNNTPVVANPALLDYFSIATIQEFIDNYVDIGLHFLKQEEFLYNSDEDWYDKMSHQSGTYFHTKMLDKNNKHNHFLLKYINISDEDGYGLLILSDITDLNLLSLFNTSDTEEKNEFFGDLDTIRNAINLFIKQEIDIKVYNFYKGLSITNRAKIVLFENDEITIKVNDNQMRASKYEKSIIIGSNAIPNFIWCDEIIEFDDKQNFIKVKNLKFMRDNPTKRKNIRLVPDEDYKISLFFKLKEFLGDVSIVDISVDGMKLKVNSLLVGMRDGEAIESSIILARKNDNINLDIHSEILRIDKYDTFFYIVIEFDLEPQAKEMLTSYISKRQMQLIREFKAL